MSKELIKHKIDQLSRADKKVVDQTNEDIATDKVKGLVRIENYLTSDLNMSGWTLTAVLDDILMCQFADINEDGTMIKRGDLWVPINAVNQAWRVAKVLLSGPAAKVKPGQYVIFPSTYGLRASNINNLKHVVFLNEDRIFGIAEQETK
ncbi:MAG: hypothetical protein EBR30_00820 [Cytophagia bacterium]|jgi:hypothetical protein|nr:hypothetical protein [Cytophagia bacterium]NBW33577.1 hypothetical protein [Cytophagia bacterium]